MPTSVLLRDNPNHLPAGGPDGGQFAPGGGGGSGGGNANSSVGGDRGPGPTSVDEARNAAAKSLSEPLNQNEVDSLKLYTSSDYERINSNLRSGAPQHVSDHENDQETVDGMDKAFSRVELYKEMTVYRGVSQSILDKIGASEGGSFTDNAFVSTSSVQGEANYFGKQGGVLRVVLPKGSKALPIEHLSRQGEQEILLNRGSKFSVKRDSSGLYLELKK